MQFNGTAWACDSDDIGTGGSFSFVLSDGTTSETINDSNTLTAAAGTGLGVVVSATDTLTYSIADQGVTSLQIANGTILLEDIAANGCTDGQVMAYNATATAWECSNAGAGTDSQTLTYTPATQVLSIADGNNVNLGSLLDNTDTLADLTCADGEIAKWNNTALYGSVLQM